MLKDIIDIPELSITVSTDSLELYDNDDDDDDLFIQAARSRYFCGEERNNSPFGTLLIYDDIMMSSLSRLHSSTIN